MFVSNGWVLLDSVLDRAEFLRQVRAMECNDDDGITCQNFPVDLEAAHRADITSVSADGRSHGDAGEEPRAGAVGAGGHPAPEESSRDIMNRLAMISFTKPQAG